MQSTGLGAFVEEFRDSAAHLKQNVLFLGPERLYGAPKDYATPRKASCFIVMPFSQEWSADVHRILASACEAADVRPVRGDDLFTPTDILEDIWQSINAADFVIADITGRNPNVLYEMGIAHTLAKPVLILSRQARHPGRPGDPARDPVWADRGGLACRPRAQDFSGNRSASRGLRTHKATAGKTRGCCWLS